MREHRYVPGKTDYDRPGKMTNECEVTWSVENGRFSMSAGIWQANKRDLLICGQMVDEVAKRFPNDIKLQRMCAIWERWHLNDMKAGSKVQEDYLRAHPIPAEDYAYPKSHYTVACQVLADAGLNPDPDGYSYGHAWKTEEIPADVLAEIQGWSS